MANTKATNKNQGVNAIHFELSNKAHSKLVDGMMRENANRVEPLSKHTYAREIVCNFLGVGVE